MKKFLILLIVGVMFEVMLSACGGRVDSGPVPIPAIPAEFTGKTDPLGSDAALAGANIFKTNCASCHGDTGHGDGPAGQYLDPRPRNLAVLQSKVADDYLFWRINTGIDGSAMVSWKAVLTDEQIWQVIAFIRTLK